MLDVKITKASVLKEKPADPGSVPFGVAFTDHMFLMDYTEEDGWQDARIVPYGNLSISPGSTVMHYAVEIFEGLKAYRTPEGKVQLFRPEQNFIRMNDSAERMCLPKLNVEDAVEYLKMFVNLEKDWVPSTFGTSLYLRPFMYATDIGLSLHGVHKATFVIIACVVGSYYKGGMQPADLLIETEDVRAVRGGTGFAKCGGNYAASMRAGEKAAEKGYSQVLWLDGVERKYVEEGGAMNVIFIWDGKLVTPELNGSILPGITRKSILAMAESWGMEVVEKKVAAEDLIAGVKSGSVSEAFMCGTAAVVTPIGAFAWEDEKVVVSGGQIGKMTQKIYDELTGIQWGLSEDKLGWTVTLD